MGSGALPVPGPRPWGLLQELDTQQVSFAHISETYRLRFQGENLHPAALGFDTVWGRLQEMM